MAPNIKPVEPLSQVVFIHDYLQLVFQDESFSIYNVANLKHRETELLQGSPGFCDALVSLIGQRVIAVSHTTEHALSLSFGGGAQLLVLSGKLGGRGPEAFQFVGPNNLIVVEQNA
jgi:hypothetical protein